MPNSAHLFLIDGLIYLSSEAKSRCLGANCRNKKAQSYAALIVVPVLTWESESLVPFVSTFFHTCY